MSMSDIRNRKLLIVTPAFNESKVIHSTLKNLKNLEAPKGWEIHLLVIDDGSVDDTYQISKGLDIQTLRHPYNCGVGIAVRTGFKWASENHFDALVQIDADGQHPETEIGKLIQKLEDEKVDIVIGSRFLGASWKISKIRRFAMRILAWMVSFGTGETITDATSGFRISGTKAIKFFANNYPGEYLGDTVESLVLAHHEGLKITETPANLVPRQGGSPSHLTIRSALHVMRVLVMVTLILIRPKTRENLN